MSAKRHGLTGTRIYATWAAMLNRCRNPNVVEYKYYGGRGVKVCERWLTFDNFLADMGDVSGRIVGKTLERINNDGDYEPRNVRWASYHDQSRNRSNNRLLSFKGKTKILADWANDLGVTPGALIYRLDYKGWSIEEALTTPKPERPNAKLNMRKARAIRALYPGLSMDKIAAKYGVSKKTVLNIIHGKIFIDPT
jgi:hypothetical protein